MDFETFFKRLTETIYTAYPFTEVSRIPSYPHDKIAITWIYKGRKMGFSQDLPLGWISEERFAERILKEVLRHLAGEIAELIVNDGRLKDSDVR